MSKFKVGDIVKFKSMEWFEKNCVIIDNKYAYQNIPHNGMPALSKEFILYNQNIQYKVEDITNTYLRKNNYVRIRSISDTSGSWFMKTFYLERYHAQV